VRRQLPLLFKVTLLATVLGAGIWLAFSPPSHVASRPAQGKTQGQAPTFLAAPAAIPASPAIPSPATPPGNVAGALQQWLREYQAVSGLPTNEPRRIALLELGSQLAEARRTWMKQTIREHPEQALQQALRFDEYAALPEAIRARVERPFSGRAEYVYLPICAGPNGEQPATGIDHVSQLSLPDGTEAEAFTYGQRATIMSKHRLPASGIVLDGIAAVNDGVFRVVQPQERAVVRAQFEAGQMDLTRSLASGQPIAGDGVLALAGDKLFAFSDPQEAQQFNTRLAALDAKPGPRAGSSVLYYEALPADLNGAFNLTAAESYAIEQASAWTETRKKVFLIRVDFSDVQGAPVTQAAASTELNGPSSDFIRAMSYGKTWVEAGVSVNVYRLPQTGAYYSDSSNPSYNSGSFSSRNSELIRDARNTFRTTRSGGDAAINIGPVDSTGNGGGGGLGDYDVVAVFFAGLGMKSGGVWYAGLAGGGDLWVQNANYTSLYTHELGHNYGLGHASFWQTSDGSVLGTGASEEYGDVFDVMGSGPAVQGHYHTQGKALLNWLTTNQWADATASGSATYRVYRIDDANTVGTPRGVRVTRSAVPGSQEYYWVGYRPIYTTNPHLQRGAYLNWQRPGETRCWLLDTTPGSAGGKNDAPVDIGKTYADPTVNVFITPLATGGAGSEQYLDVRVNLGPYPANHAPTSSGITGPATVAARTPYTYAANASDLDSDPLAYYWDAQDGLINNSSSTLTHTWVVGGTGSLAVTVSDMKGGTVTVSNSVTVIDPLDTWSTGSVGTARTLETVMWAKSRLVTADYFGNAYLSWDGSTWENEGALPNFESLVSYRPQLAFGANKFVVVGKKAGAAAAQICYSLDGRLWSEASFPAGVPQAQGVAYGAGQFVAVGDSGTVLRSTNGVNWTVTTVPGTPSFRFIAFDGSTWLAVALNSSSYAERLWTSLDGVNWTQQSLLGMQVFDLSSAGSTAYALGYYGGLKYSTDHGLTWQNALLPGTTQWSTYHMAAAEDGTLLLAGQAMNESGAPYALLVSSDGRTWSRASGNTDVAAACHALTFGCGRFLSAGANGAIRQSATFFPNNTAPSASFTTAPTNGPARTPIYFAANATDANGDSLTYAWDFGSQSAILDGLEIAPSFSLGGSYTLTLRVSDGHGGLTTLTQPLTITDPARTWTKRTTSSSDTLTAIAASPTNVVTVGDHGTILSSPDGITWTARNIPEYAYNIYFNSIIWDGARYLAVGQDYDFGISAWVGVLYSSADGLNWMRRYQGGANSTLNALAANASTRVAVGDSGTVLVSLNGTNWSGVTIPGLGTPTMSGAAFGGGVFLFVGYIGGNGSPKVYTSTDGTNWIDRAAGAGLASWQDLRKAAWLNDRFVASGWYSKLRFSTDGGQTFSSNRPHTEEVPALAYGDGVWFTAGVDRDASNANVDVMSLDGVNWLSFPAPVNVSRNGAVFFKHTLIAVGDAGNIWQSGSLSPASGFPAWQLTNFPAGGLPSLANRDPDGDGVINAAEYAFGRNPNSAAGPDGASQLPRGFTQTNRFWLHLDLPEPAPYDVVYSVRGTTNLAGTWNTIAIKTGTGAWQWLGGGTARLNSGTVSGGRISVDVGPPDSVSASRNYYLRLNVQTP